MTINSFAASVKNFAWLSVALASEKVFTDPARRYDATGKQTSSF